MPLLSQLGSVQLKSVNAEDKRDRSEANVKISGPDVLEDEAERWKYFFESGCSGWFETIKAHTFRSTFVELRQEEAEVIVEHWEKQQRLGGNGFSQALFEEAKAALVPCCERLDIAVKNECVASSSGLAFVKLSTRSPKDSRRALAKAKVAYEARLRSLGGTPDDNEKWKILSEEVTRAGAVASGTEALDLLLDSERVFEDLEYALRGPKKEATQGTRPRGASRHYDMCLVARAWDARLSLQSEFRGIAWGGRLTCLCQYFHPLVFPELLDLKTTVEEDCRELFASTEVTSAVSALGGNCIIDFAWLGKGDVMIVELNPFDGMCLGTFPASTGLFLWDDEHDRAIMKGEAAFETRVRESALPPPELKVQCNPGWRRIIYSETEVKSQ
eukprot:TRINITY_DN95310_c0_g1_i1.p1 TRINITY_DN95310_c0_g1~~TRINITY_DN95310_c0_g1_i1.p1  ORF type:complete len:387 (+),score=69.52 TRINITY_DN95310_c0_g1_i1:60-1220(+)